MSTISFDRQSKSQHVPCRANKPNRIDSKHSIQTISQEALEKAEQEERRRSSLALGNSNARSSGAGAGASAKTRHGKSGRGGSSGSGGRACAGGGDGTVAHNDEKAAEAYSLALARVRHETVQEGLRKKGHK